MKSRISPLAFLPPVVFLILAALFYYNLGQENARDLPSMMIGREAPTLMNFTDLRDDPAFTDADLRAPGVKLVNFWASWCVACRAEHPVFMELQNRGVVLYGIDYKDKPEDGLQYLADRGDPYTKVGADFTGRTAIEWGVYGVPETFIIDGNGKVLMRHIGPVTMSVYENKIKPMMEAADKGE